MTKDVFLTRLEKSLGSLSFADRSEAMQYYSEYFDDSPLSEEETCNKLGDPDILARQIIAESKIQNAETMSSSPKKGLSAVAAIILAIFAIPIGLPILIALAVVVLSVLISVFAVVLSLFVTAIALVVAGIAVFFASFAMIPVSLINAFYFLGSAMVCIGFGALLFYATFKINSFVIDSIIKISKRILGRNKNEKIY